MKYFTPELLLRCRCADPDASDKAYEEWMKNVDDYASYLEKCFARMAVNGLEHLKEYIEKLLALHDWRVIGQGLGYKSEDFIIVLGGFGQTVDLLYSPCREEEGGGVKVIQWDSMKCAGSKNLYWLYDEFNLDSDDIFVHSILFNNGTELQITFNDFFWETLKPVMLG